MPKVRSTAESIAGAAHQFHRTIDGIRELLDLVEPHLGGEDLNEFLASLEDEQQGALALVFVTLVREAGWSGTLTVTSPSGGVKIKVAPATEERRPSSGSAQEHLEEPTRSGAELEAPEAIGASSSESSGGDEVMPDKTSGDGGDSRTGRDKETPIRVRVRLDPSFRVSREYAELVSKLAIGDMSSEEVAPIIRDVIPADSEILEDFVDLLTGQTVESRHVELVNRSMLITAVAAFETLLTRVLARQIGLFPNLLARSEMQFSLSDLEAFGSIEDARAAAIERRVESIMAGALDDWEDWLRNSAKIAMSDLAIDREQLAEVFERRHVVFTMMAEPHEGTSIRLVARFL